MRLLRTATSPRTTMPTRAASSWRNQRCGDGVVGDSHVDEVAEGLGADRRRRGPEGDRAVERDGQEQRRRDEEEPGRGAEVVPAGEDHQRIAGVEGDGAEQVGGVDGGGHGGGDHRREPAPAEEEPDGDDQEDAERARLVHPAEHVLEGDALVEAAARRISADHAEPLQRARVQGDQQGGDGHHGAPGPGRRRAGLAAVPLPREADQRDQIDARQDRVLGVERPLREQAVAPRDEAREHRRGVERPGHPVAVEQALAAAGEAVDQVGVLVDAVERELLVRDVVPHPQDRDPKRHGEEPEQAAGGRGERAHARTTARESRRRRTRLTSGNGRAERRAPPALDDPSARPLHPRRP